MITRTPFRTRKLLLLGLVVSLLLHLFGGALWPYAKRAITLVMQSLPQTPVHEPVAIADPIRLERKVITKHPAAHHPPPRPKPPVPKPPQPIARVAPPKPRALPQAVKAVSAPAPKPEIVHVTIHTPKRIVAQGGTHSDDSRPTVKPPAQVEKTTKELTPEQIAKLTSSFQKTIADSRPDLENIAHETSEAPTTMKHYSMQFVGTRTDLKRGQGYIEPITPRQRIGNTVWYYTHYTYMHLDGTIEEDDIPWPFHFPINADPFAIPGRVSHIPLQPPPDGYRPNRPLKAVLMQFFGGPIVED